MKKLNDDEVFCFSCESRLFKNEDKLGPICPNCFKKTKRRDPLLAAAIARAVVAIVPTVCPHDGRKHGKCKYGSPTACYFNVIVLDKNLEPVEITGPYTSRAAEKKAKSLRRRKR